MSASPQNALAKFIDEAQRAIPDPKTLEPLLSGAIVAITQASLPDAVIDRLLTMLGEIALLAKAERRAWDYFYLPRDQHFGTESAARMGELAARVAELRPYVQVLGDGRHQPDGYTAKTLMLEADIGKDLWRDILGRTSLGKSPRGGQHRRFSASHVRTLAQAARGKGTENGIEIARKWLILIGDSP